MNRISAQHQNIIFAKIFSFLDGGSLGKVALVCKLFKSIVNTLSDIPKSLETRTVSKPSIHMKLIQTIGGSECYETLPQIVLDENNKVVYPRLLGPNKVVKGIDLLKHNFLAARFFHKHLLILQLFYRDSAFLNNSGTDYWTLKTRIFQKNSDSNEYTLRTIDLEQKDVHVSLDKKRFIIELPLHPKIQPILKISGLDCRRRYDLQYDKPSEVFQSVEKTLQNLSPPSSIYCFRSMDIYGLHAVGLQSLFIEQLLREEKKSLEGQSLWTLESRYLGEPWTSHTFDLNDPNVLMSLNSRISIVNLKDYFHYKIFNALDGITRLNKLPFIDLNLQSSLKVTAGVFGNYSKIIGLVQANNFFIGSKYRTAINAHTETIQLIFHNSSDPQNIWTCKTRVNEKDTIEKWDLKSDVVVLTFTTHFKYSVDLESKLGFNKY